MAGLLVGLIIVVIMFGAGFSVYSKFLSNQNIISSSPSPIQEVNISSGIAGKILLGPQCPAVQINHEDQNCEPRPYQTTIVVKTIDGRKVTEFSSNINGEFKIKLAPGNYWLEAADQSKLPHLVPTPVDVEVNKFKEVTLRFDTGIR